MKIETKDIITLNNADKYVVCSKVEYENNSYLYLINPVNPIDIKFGIEKHKENKTFISELKDEALIRQLLPLFYEKSKNIINVEES